MSARLLVSPIILFLYSPFYKSPFLWLGGRWCNLHINNSSDHWSFALKLALSVWPSIKLGRRFEFCSELKLPKMILLIGDHLFQKLLWSNVFFLFWYIYISCNIISKIYSSKKIRPNGQIHPFLHIYHGVWCNFSQRYFMLYTKKT